MKLVEDQRAPNPRRVRIFLAEKAIDIDREQIDIMAEDHKTPERKQQNPFTRVPYLILDDGTIIAETMAICRYFEVIQPEPALFGKTALEQATIEMWNRRVEQNLLDSVAHAFRHQSPHMAHLEVPQVPEWGKANVEKVKAVLNLLESELASRAFIAGDSFSVADVTALCTIDFMKVARLRLGDEHTNLKRWHESVSARPSASA